MELVEIKVDDKAIIGVTPNMVHEGTGGLLAFAIQPTESDNADTKGTAIAMGSTRILGELIGNLITDMVDIDKAELSEQAAEIAKVTAMGLGIAIARADLIHRNAKSEGDKSTQGYATDIVHQIVHGLFAGVQQAGTEAGLAAYEAMGLPDMDDEEIPDEAKAALAATIDNDIIPNTEIWAIMLGALSNHFGVECGITEKLMKDHGITK